jgi:hypothetical protein
MMMDITAIVAAIFTVAVVVAIYAIIITEIRGPS